MSSFTRPKPESFEVNNNNNKRMNRVQIPPDEGEHGRDPRGACQSKRTSPGTCSRQP